MGKIEDFIQLNDFNLLKMIKTLKENNVMSELTDRYEAREFYHYCARINYAENSNSDSENTYNFLMDKLSL